MPLHELVTHWRDYPPDWLISERERFHKVTCLVLGFCVD